MRSPPPPANITPCAHGCSACTPSPPTLMPTTPGERLRPTPPPVPPPALEALIWPARQDPWHRSRSDPHRHPATARPPITPRHQGPTRQLARAPTRSTRHRTRHLHRPHRPCPSCTGPPGDAVTMPSCKPATGAGTTSPLPRPHDSTITIKNYSCRVTEPICAQFRCGLSGHRG